MDERQGMAKKVKKTIYMFWNTFRLGLLVFLILLICFSTLSFWVWSKIPSDKELKGCLVTELYKVSLCPGSSNYVPLNKISSHLQKTVVLTEDSSFWQHNGFDLQEMQNSLKKNLETGKFARGGSTITQQLAKNLFLSKDKTISRKLIEALITVRIEKSLNKKEILERYLNVVQFGKDIFGIKQGAQFYFKKSPAELSVLESAFFAYLLPSPEVYSKSFYKKKLTPFAEKRLSEILDNLYKYHLIADEDYLTAKGQLTYFLSGQEPPVIDPAIDKIEEEDAEEALDDFTD